MNFQINANAAAFILHSVIVCGSRHGSQNISNIISFQLRAFANCVAQKSE